MQPRPFCARRVAELASRQTLFGWTAEKVGQDERRRKCHHRRARRPGPTEHCTADYVVGCDGSRSLVRAQSGITQSLSDHDRLMVLLVFRSPELAPTARALSRQVVLQRSAP